MSKYNGWTNYETWNVALWLSNNEEWTNFIGESTRYHTDIGWIESTWKLMGTTIGWKRVNPDDEWDITYETPDGVEYMPTKGFTHPKVNWQEIFETFKSDWAEEDEDV